MKLRFLFFSLALVALILGVVHCDASSESVDGREVQKDTEKESARSKIKSKIINSWFQTSFVEGSGNGNPSSELAEALRKRLLHVWISGSSSDAIGPLLELKAYCESHGLKQAFESIFDEMVSPPAGSRSGTFNARIERHALDLAEKLYTRGEFDLANRAFWQGSSCWLSRAEQLDLVNRSTQAYYWLRVDEDTLTPKALEWLQTTKSTVGVEISDQKILKQLIGLSSINGLKLQLADSRLLSDAVKTFPDAQKLSITGSSISDNELCKQLRKMRKLNTLHLEKRDLTRALVQCISTHTKLKTLSFVEVRVDSKRLNSFDSGFLTELLLERVQFENLGSQYLALPSLKKLTIRDTEIGGDFLEKLSQLSTLEELDLRYTGVEPQDLSRLGGLKQLKRILLPFDSRTDEWLIALKRLPSIAHLDLHDLPALSPKSLSLLATMPNISDLNVRLDDISDHQLGELGRMKTLKALKLTGDQKNTRVTDIGVEQLRDLPYLTNLEIEDFPLVTGTAFQTGFLNLRTLSLERCGVTDVGVKTLSRLSGLCLLNLRGNKITDQCLNSILELRNLTDLDLCATTISVSGVDTIEKDRKDCKVRPSISTIRKDYPTDGPPPEALD